MYNVLKFMASNGLVANAKKTTFIILNDKSKPTIPQSINVGTDKVQQENHAKLLGVTIDDDQKWSSQIKSKRFHHSTQDFTS